MLSQSNGDENMADETFDEDKFDLENGFKILIATDNHIGYMERDQIRCDDSIRTFEEILSIAVEEDVDFILLGGDLFHENKPSRSALHETIALIRKYTLGDKPCNFEYLSDKDENFKYCRFPGVNMEDPNMNVSIPIFIIHGNHDDPAGPGALSSIDILSVSGLVNYFGKANTIERVELHPLILRKGATQLALYGIGSIRDQRLYRMLQDRSVVSVLPPGPLTDFFHLFVLHQNRAQHSANNHIPEQFIDNFFDLIFWAHEHECRIEPEWNPTQRFYVTQPGSSVATSISEAETRPKHCGLLFIRNFKDKREFWVRPVPLKTVRQMYIRDIVLSQTDINPDHAHATKQIEILADNTVKELIALAKEEHSGERSQPKQPLIRLKIEYSGGFQPFNIHRFGHQFAKMVANPRDMIVFHRKRSGGGAGQFDNNLDDPTAAAFSQARADSDEAANVEAIVEEYFKAAGEKNHLYVLSEKAMSAGVYDFVHRQEPDSVESIVRHGMKNTEAWLNARNANEESVSEELLRYRDDRRARAAAEPGSEERELEAIRDQAKRSSSRTSLLQPDAAERPQPTRNTTRPAFDDSDDDNDDELPPPRRPEARGRAAAKLGTSTRGRATRGRKK